MRRSIAKKLKQLSLWELRLLRMVLEGDAVTMWIDGKRYAAYREEDDSIVFVSLEDGHTRTVIGGACSCEDFRFRHRDCKHILACRKLFYG